MSSNPATRTGVYLMADDPSDVLETIILNAKSLRKYLWCSPNSAEVCLNADIFLHGICGIFAMALHNRFGYAIRKINGLDEDNVEDGEDPYEFLLHIYCVTDNGLFVDVRGMTHDSDELIDPFLDLCDKDSISGYSYDTEECEGIIRNEMSDEEYAYFYNAALSIIDSHPDWYSLEDSK